MKIEQQYKLVAFMAEMQKNLSKISLLQTFVHLIHLIWMLVLITKITSKESCNSNQICLLIREKLQQNLLVHNSTQIIHFLFIFLTILKIVEALIYMIFSAGIAQLLKNKKLCRIISIAGTVGFLVSQILIYPAIQYVIWTGSNSSLFLALGLGTIIYASYFLINSNFSDWSLYSQLTLVIVPLISTNHNIISHIIVVIFSLYKLLITKSKITKIIYVPIITTILSNQWAFNFSTYLRLNTTKNGIYLGILTFIFMVFVYFSAQKVTLFNQLGFWKGVLQRTQAIQGHQKIRQFYSVDQTLKVYNVIVGRAKLYIQNYTQSIEYKLRLDLRVKDFLGICEQVLDKVAQQQQNYQLKLILIEYMMLNGQSLSKILQLIHTDQIKLQRMNFRQKIEYVRVLQKLRINYGCFKINNQLQVAEVQQADATLNLFVSSVERLITMQVQFWEMFLSDRISRSQVYQKFEQLSTLRGKLNQQKTKLDNFSFYADFRAVYEQIQNKISQYDIESALTQLKTPTSKKASNNHYQGLTSMNNDQISHDDGDNEYLVLSDQKIQRISSSLAAQIQVNKQDFTQSEWTELFIPEICEYLQQGLNAVSQKNQERTIYIPFFKDKFCFVSSVVKILWFPSIDGKMKYMLRFYNLIENVYLFYNVQKGLITSYNQKFIEDFQLSQVKVKNQIQKEDFTFQRLFSMQFTTAFPDYYQCKRDEKQQKIRKQKQFYQVQINLVGLFQQENQEMFSLLKKRLRINEYIYVGQSRFAILELQCTKQNIKKMNSDNLSSNTGFKKLNTLQNKYQNETFFCPIHNSYESVITEKLAALKNTCRFTSCIWSIIIGVVLVSFSAFQNVFSYQLFSQRIDMYKAIQQSINEGSDQYILIYKMYKASIKRYQTQQYPENVISSRGQSLAEAMASTTEDQQTYLDKFIAQYIAHIHEQPNQRIPYSLAFDQFNISTNTDQSTLMDFADNFKKNLELNQTDFIFENYLSFRELTFDFQKSNTYREKIQGKYQEAIIFYIVCIVTVFLIVAYMYMVSLKTENNIYYVTDIYSNITNEQIMEKINDLNNDKQRYFAKKKKKVVSTLHPYVSISNSLLSRSSISKMEQDIAKFSIQLLKDVKTKQYTFFKNRKREQLMEEGAHVRKKVIFVTNFEKCLLFLFNLTVIGLYSLYFGIDLSSLNTQRQKISQIFDYQKHIWDRVFGMNRLNSDAYMFAVYKHKFNRTLQLPVKQNFLKARFEKKTNFPQISLIQQSAQNLIQGNLCSLAMQHVSVQMIPCEEYVDGAMTRGYSGTYINFINLSEQVKNKQLSQLESEKCTLIYCPPQYAFDYISTRLNNAAQMVFDIFKMLQKQLIQNMQKDDQFLLLCKCLSYGFLLSVLGIFVYLQIKTSSRALQLFKMFPRNVIIKVRITNYLRKQKILDRLDQL